MSEKTPLAVQDSEQPPVIVPEICEIGLGGLAVVTELPSLMATEVGKILTQIPEEKLKLLKAVKVEQKLTVVPDKLLVTLEIGP
jgi:hypothetical protein